MSVSSIGGSSSLQAMQQLLFSSLDTNQDGQISSDEFSALGQSAPSDTGQTSHTSSASASDRIGGDTLSSLIASQAQDRFDAADTNGDGKLSADEIAAGMAANAPAGATGDTTEMAANFLKKADSDGDGSVSESEFAAAMPKHGHHMHGAGPPPPPETADASSATTSTSTAASTTASADGSSSSGSASVQNPADTNGDGVVSAGELMAYLQGASSNLTSGVSDLMKTFLSQLDNLNASSSASASTSVTA